ncbi:RUS family member 1 [Bufo gargarizans]|uniref:RUS family member 1 n=1 Tax=Bufo gargarizans TaxID=30331 RepID=UPI001CF32EEE|nr:RUS family member 1 [Bufo gargarizans]XP_044159107.1 RUS family member 1 [Bufo gargarizans]
MSSEDAVMVCTERYGSGDVLKYIKCDDGTVCCQRAHQAHKYRPLRDCFTSLFLPHGFPDSVSEDYLEYQLWDTLQAFSSSVTGSLATHALLRGSGVGDSAATVTGATITWILRDGTGMVGRILFAWMKGSRLDCDAKRWRLFADVLNDLAIFMEILAPVFPSCFTVTVCIAGVFKCIVGVAGGATRAALTVHQARRDNMADVCAKDGSQETLVNLAGLLVSLVLVPMVSDSIWGTYLLFLLLTCLHLYANYRAVRSVVMETLNQSRLSIVLEHYLLEGRILSPAEANPKELLLPGLGAQVPVDVGVALNAVVSSASQLELLKKGNDSLYLLGWRRDTGRLAVVLHEKASSADIIRSVVHAEILHRKTFSSDPARYGILAETHGLVSGMFPDFRHGLCASGWVTDRNLLDSDDWRANWEISKGL